ncbi:hypothetical protein [Myxococcus stipitatus]|uniref:hypothetical protein n=1 Tax=Myxococcus stipitatus TaxID=83455 RepID=UPI0030D39E2F
MSGMMRGIANLSGLVGVVGALVSGSASAACWSWPSSPTFDIRWAVGMDSASADDDASLLTDNGLLRFFFPTKCSGTYGCDIVEYSIQWYTGSWQSFTPGMNDADPMGYSRRAWAYFYDHNFRATVCN